MVCGNSTNALLKIAAWSTTVFEPSKDADARPGMETVVQVAIEKFIAGVPLPTLRQGFSMHLAAVLRRDLAAWAERYTRLQAIPHCLDNTPLKREDRTNRCLS